MSRLEFILDFRILDPLFWTCGPAGNRGRARVQTRFCNTGLVHLRGWSLCGFSSFADLVLLQGWFSCGAGPPAGPVPLRGRFFRGPGFLAPGPSAGLALSRGWFFCGACGSGSSPQIRIRVQLDPFAGSPDIGWVRAI